MARVAIAATLLACDSKRPPVQEVPDVLAVTGPTLVGELIDESSKYARDQLGLRAPRLTFALLGCVDSTGKVDRASSQCPGSVVTSFEDGAAASALPAFVANGPGGVRGYRAPRTAIIVLDPARCTPTAFLVAARARGLTWSWDKDTVVSYGPRLMGGAFWSVTRKGEVTFSMSDDECAKPPASP